MLLEIDLYILSVFHNLYKPCISKLSSFHCNAI